MRLTVPDRSPCPYCENLAGRYASHGPPAIIVEDESLVIFLSPAALGLVPGHTLVTTRRHVETIFDLSHEEEAAVAHAVGRMARVIRNVVDPEGLLVQQHNGVAAFQTVPHLHVHVIPKTAEAQFPPTEWIEVTPIEQRLALAETLRAEWDRLA
jgi:histidine triad (HIT) family protein